MEILEEIEMWEEKKIKDHKKRKNTRKSVFLFSCKKNRNYYTLVNILNIKLWIKSHMINYIKI